MSNRSRTSPGAQADHEHEWHSYYLVNGAISRRNLVRFAAATAGLAGAAPLVAGAATAAPGTQAQLPALFQSADGTLTVARAGDADTLDPQHTILGLSLEVLYRVYDQLTAVNPDTQDVEGILAESWDISDDGTEYTFHLRQGISFHDGTPFNAEAVKFAFDRALDPATNTPTVSWVGPLSSVEVIDDNTVKFVLSEPFSPLLGNIASGYFSIPSPAAVQEKGDANYGIAPVGTGPWKFVEWVSGESITLAPNPDYKNFRGNAENKGAPLLNELIFRVIPEADTQLAAFETGEINLITPPQREVKDMQENSDYEVIVSKTSTGTSYLEFSMIAPPEGQFGATWKAPFDDPRLRQAVAYAVDVDNIIANVLEGLATRNYGPMPTALFAYKPEIEQYGYHHDADKAKALLAEAGWADADGDGVLEKGDAKLDVLFWSYEDPTTDKIVQVIQNQLQEVGFKVTLEILEVGTMLARLSENVSDLNIMGWGQTEPDMLRGMTNGTWGVGRYRDAEYQGYVTDALKTTDRAERTDLYFQAAQKMLADAAIVPLYTPLTVLAARSDVKGLKFAQQEQALYEDISIEN